MAEMIALSIAHGKIRVQYFFQTRVQYTPLNAHLERICRQDTAECQVCSHPNETDDRHLLEHKTLDDIRHPLLIPRPSKLIMLYGDRQQIETTCKFRNLALG